MDNKKKGDITMGKKSKEEVIKVWEIIIIVIIVITTKDVL